jgi:hypothetical protein
MVVAHRRRAAGTVYLRRPTALESILAKQSLAIRDSTLAKAVKRP